MKQVKAIQGIVILLLIGMLVSVTQSYASEDRSLFWSIESDHGLVGYLLGTIHSEDPRVLEYTEDFLTVLGGTDQFAMELVPNLPTLTKLTEVMHLPEGTSLDSVIGKDRFEAVAMAMSAYGIPSSQTARMKPWAAMITLSVPAPKTGFFMDFSLSLRASGNGVKVIGLETLDDQLGFLENMPMEHQLSMLDQAVAETGMVEEIHQQMIESYLVGDLSALRDETEEQLSGLGDEAQAYFMAEGIDARNHRMMKALLAALDEGTVFTAVGALHLPGENGLIALLRNKGFYLSPMPSPFPEQP